MRQTIFTLLLVGLLGVGFASSAWAGEWYLNPEDPTYWWFVDGDPRYEVLVPADLDFYVEYEWSNHRFVHIMLRNNGPHLFVGSAPGTDVQALWQSLTAPWSMPLRNPRVVENSEITTSRGVRARFMVLSGSNQQGAAAMIRMVAFTKDGRTSYLMWVGLEREYTGDLRQFWLRAVNSFGWL